jgi:nitrite reductase/ring-hydroxylating ferredoxin subunit
VDLETQIPRPHDYVTTFIGGQPVLLIRAADGRIGCFLNTCRHRATVVCPFKRGRQKLHVCRYRGWAYDSAGKNISVTDRDDGNILATSMEPIAILSRSLAWTAIEDLFSPAYRPMCFRSRKISMSRHERAFRLVRLPTLP